MTVLACADYIQSRSKRPSFDELNDLRRHARHIEEVQEVSVETLERLASRQEDNFRQLELEEDYQSEAIEYLRFQLQIMKSLRRRSQANSERLDGEMNLVGSLITIGQVFHRVQAAKVNH